MKSLLTALLLFAGLSLHAQTAVMFSWDPNQETNCAGYKLLSGPAPRTYTVTNVFMGRLTSVGTVSNVPPGKTYFAVVAFDGTGMDSDFSNEVSWTNKPPPPRNLRLVGTMQASANPAGPWRDLARVVVPAPPIGEPYYRAVVVAEEVPTLGTGDTAVSPGRQ